MVRQSGAVLFSTIVLALAAGAAACGAGEESCGAACYNPTQYVCSGTQLCPTSDPCNCGGACYGTYAHTNALGDPFYYGCTGGGLFNSDSQQTCVGGVSGDPHFVGYDGQRFDFMGQPGEHWAIFSEPMLQLNALFDKDPVHFGTNMVAVGLKHGDHRVTIRLLWTEDGKHGADIEVIADNQAVGPGETVKLSHDLQVERLPAPSMEWYHLVWIRTGQYDFLIECPPEHPDMMNKTSDSPQWAPRLDIAQATIKQMPSYELHGVLGQTYNVFKSKDSGNSNANISASSQENVDGPQQPYEGADEDYRVSDLFATDFKFNKYTGVAGSLVSRARRMLTTSHPLTASVVGGEGRFV